MKARIKKVIIAVARIPWYQHVEALALL